MSLNLPLASRVVLGDLDKSVQQLYDTAIVAPAIFRVHFLHLWPVQNHVVVNLQQRLDCPLAGHAVDDSDAFARLGGIKHTRDVVGVIHLGFWFSPDSKVVTHGSSIFP